jgi:hypothetical protein
MMGWKKWIALVCLLLTVGSAAVIVAHHHASAAEAGQCAACVVAHSPAAVIATQAPGVASVSLAVSAPLRVTPRPRLADFSLYVRPPPAA